MENTENKKFLFPFFKREKENLGLGDNIVVVDNLRKTYGNFVAVDDISFSVRRGGLFAFLGLNGAGKSTTINIITGILSKDSGKIVIDGVDVDKERQLIKHEIGIVFQNSVLDPVLTPRENLTLRAGFYGITGDLWKERLKTISDLLELEPFLDRPLGKLSGGQKRRVDIARAMVHDPKLLILDEPTTGLDPQTRLSVWNLVNSLRAKTGMTVFLTTHYMEEAEKATYVVILSHGRIIAEGTPLELKNQYSGNYVVLHVKKNPQVEEVLNQSGHSYNYLHDQHVYRILVKDSADALSFLDAHKDILDDFEVEKGSMDDVFLNATGARAQMEEHSNGNQD